MLQKKLTQILNNINHKKKICIFLLILSSFSFTFYYGFIGLFPLDSFLIYDAGYKIINGSQPFKDYWSITGPILDYIQFILFKIFGINWFSYVLHSAFINFLITIFFFYFFSKLKINIYFNFFYSLSASILAYPSVGTPFMDHHAVFFSLIAVIFMILAFKEDKVVYWFLIPIFLLISFLSKQIPSAYLLISFLGIILAKIVFYPSKNFKFLYSLILGALASTFVIFFYFFIADIPWKNFLIQYIFYPLEIGAERNNTINLDLDNVFFKFKFIYFSLIPLFFILVKTISSYKNYNIRKDIILIIFILFVIASFIFGQIMTKNQILIFILIPFCLGVSHYFCEKYSKNKFINLFLISLLIISTIKFHIRFNENKKFMELNNVNLNLAVDSKILDKSLSGLKWITSENPKNPEIEINNLVEIKKVISADKTKKIIISDYQILPSIIGLKTTSPNKWFDHLSVPDKNNKYFEEYKIFFRNSLINQSIETIYFTKDKEQLFSNILETRCYSSIKIKKEFFKLKINNCLGSK